MLPLQQETNWFVVALFLLLLLEIVSERFDVFDYMNDDRKTLFVVLKIGANSKYGQLCSDLGFHNLSSFLVPWDTQYATRYIAYL